MSKWDISIKKFSDSKKEDFVEICTCAQQERFLRFYAKKEKYQGECGCQNNFPCAKLQINKHQVELYMKRKKFLGPYFEMKKKNPRVIKSPYDQTLDQFFGE